MATADATPTTQVGVHEAKTRLSELLRIVDAGGTVEILRNGRPAARLVPPHTAAARVFGADAGRFQVPDDFDAPLADDLIKLFEQ